jgi:hypothetical protein
MPEAASLLVSVAPDSDGEMLDECTPEMAPFHVAPWQRPSSTALMLAAAAADEDADDAPSRAIKKQAWTPEEDAKLLAMVEHHGPSSWSQIALHLPGRVGKQCRERWHNHLSPEVKKENFTEEEVRRGPAPLRARLPDRCASVLCLLAASRGSMCPGRAGARRQGLGVTGACPPLPLRTDSSWRRSPSTAPNGRSS